MDTAETVALLRTDIAGLRNDISVIKQDIGILEAKTEAVETWRVRYLAQEDQTVNKMFVKIDKLMISLNDMRADLARIRGERDAERRIGVMIISVLSAMCGGLCARLLHG
jgi:hypothetical protein